MRDWIDAARVLVEGEVIEFPRRDPTPTHQAIAQGGADIVGFPGHVDITDPFVTGYVIAALWSTTDLDGEPLDGVHGVDDIASPTLHTMAADCTDFQDSNRALLDQAYQTGKYDAEQAGHDFWLTRNRHGAGFWDRGLGQLGRDLTTAAIAYGGFDLIVGDDGMIHGS